MKQQTKLSENHEQVVEQQSQTKAAREFKNSDELLRFDAAETEVPVEIADRLQKSTTRVMPSEVRPWWKNFFGGKA